MLKMLKSLCVALMLVVALMTLTTRVAIAQEISPDRYAASPFATALAVASAAMSVAAAANAVTAAATAVGGAAEGFAAGVTVVGGASMATVILSGVGIAAVLYMGTAQLTAMLDTAQGVVLAFQGR